MMALAIIWSKFSEGEQMTLGLLTALTMLKSIASFSGFYSLNSHYRKMFKPPTSNKHWKDWWFFVGGTWLAVSESICERIPNNFL